MPRAARIVIPTVPHHLIQRGSRRQDVFFSDEDKEFYLQLLLKWSRIAKMAIWAYCLMTNHVHLIAVPFFETSLRRCMAEVHKRYAQVVNKRQGWAGHLWQARFISYPMDEIYGYRATRYVELNPVRAGLMTDPGAYRWSSAAAHLGLSEDLLLGRNPFGMSNVEWSRYLAEGLIESEAELFREHARNERPLGGENFLKRYGLI